MKKIQCISLNTWSTPGLGACRLITEFGLPLGRNAADRILRVQHEFTPPALSQCRSIPQKTEAPPLSGAGPSDVITNDSVFELLYFEIAVEHDAVPVTVPLG